MKKLKFLLQLHDGIWSVPLALGIFYLSGFLLQHFFGMCVGTYDPGFFQPLILAICIVVGATNAAVFGMLFTFRGLYRYFYGQKREQDGVRVNYSKFDWVKISAWQRYLIGFGVFFYFVTAVIIVYLKLV